MVIVAAITAMLLLRPNIIKAQYWRAVVTPLASIIGSGFLVAGPILAFAAGTYAWIAMLGLCSLAYLFGAAIRHNISYIEPLHGNALPKYFRLIEHVSSLALAFAYFVSVSYYINLFAAFALRADDIINPNLTQIVASLVIGGLGLLGAVRGFRAFENIEAVAVALKLAIIIGLLAALSLAAFYPVSGPLISDWSSKPVDVPILLGLVILVQGFETSRYLGHQYDGPTRVKTMKMAQLLSTAIYVAFIALMMPLFTGNMPTEGGETEIITLLAPLGATVGPLIIFAALASQLSAALADMSGAGGLLNDASDRHIRLPIAYIITAAFALLFTWSASIMEIILYASKAFVFYYGLQSLMAFLSCLKSEQTNKKIMVSLFGLAVAMSVMALMYGEAVSP
jgi:hypothetical protein